MLFRSQFNANGIAATLAAEGGAEAPELALEHYSPEYGARESCAVLRIPFSGVRQARLITRIICSRFTPADRGAGVPDSACEYGDA